MGGATKSISNLWFFWVIQLVSHWCRLQIIPPEFQTGNKTLQTKALSLHQPRPPSESRNRKTNPPFGVVLFSFSPSWKIFYYSSKGAFKHLSHLSFPNENQSCDGSALLLSLRIKQSSHSNKSQKKKIQSLGWEQRAKGRKRCLFWMDEPRLGLSFCLEHHFCFHSEEMSICELFQNTKTLSDVQTSITPSESIIPFLPKITLSCRLLEKRNLTFVSEWCDLFKSDSLDLLVVCF